MLGPKIHLKSIKNLSKNNIKKSLVFWLILCWFLLDFGSKLGGPRGSNEPAFRWLVGSWGQDSPKRPPRAPQEPPKSLQDPSKRALGTDFWSIFDRFWMHFWQMFCGLVVDFWYFFEYLWSMFCGPVIFPRHGGGDGRRQLDPAPPKGCSCVRPTPVLSKFPILQCHPGNQDRRHH